MHAVHNIEPIYDENSKILILGSFPSVKSREQRFFYHHPQNRFWETLAAVLDRPVPETVEQKKRFLIRNGIALWDAVESCDIENSSDSSIKNVKANDIGKITSIAQIKAIFANGATAHKLCQKHCKDIAANVRRLPSTSPANAACSQAELIAAWSAIKEYIF